VNKAAVEISRNVLVCGWQPLADESRENDVWCICDVSAGAGDIVSGECFILLYRWFDSTPAAPSGRVMDGLSAG
jgi:hypothetical protein